jgi:(E)-4-hydroxy-3-methylbut-2-enyl-diphosphate synthase
MDRKETRLIKVKNVLVGGKSPVTIQSMTNTDTRDSEKTLMQIRTLYNAGCEIIRCAVPDMEAAEALKIITSQSPIPVVADIHFDYKLALNCRKWSCCIKDKSWKYRYEKVKMVVEAAKTS